jgi:hypothetical protein
MTKIVGMMCVKDEADLLPQVLPHVRGLVDHLYVYEDGSQDNTWDLVKDEHYVMRRQDDRARTNHNRGNYHHLLEKIKKDFKGEEVWAIITMGDRFYLNKTPRQIVEEAGKFDAVEGVQLDFLRHRLDPWTEENDPYPDFSDIRTLCRWFKFDERCIVAYKVTPELSYRDAKYPWPRGIKEVQYKHRAMGGLLSMDMPYLEHQGRRSPKAAIARYQNGSRVQSKKYNYDLSSYERAVETMACFRDNYRMFPWVDNASIEELVKFRNDKQYQGNPGKPAMHALFMEAEAEFIRNPLPKREV